MGKRLMCLPLGVLLCLLAGSLSACSQEELFGEELFGEELFAEELLKEIPGQAQLETTECVTVSDSFLSEKIYPYAYNSLTEQERQWYDDIAQILGNMQEEVKLSGEGFPTGLDETCIDRIFQCVLNDHPELFYVSGYTYTKYYRGEKLVAIEFSGTYELSRQEAAARKREIDAAADILLGGIDIHASEYERVKYVYDTIVKNTDYDLTALDNQNIYSVFVGHRSVCQGYAKAAQYLLNRLDIPCTLVQGSVEDGQGHAWNLVKVDGSFYYLDVTWGDASYQNQDGVNVTGGQQPEINYDYFCITTQQLLGTHTLDNCVPMPQCTDMAASYYVRQGAYFESYDRNQLDVLFRNTLQNGGKDVTIKCADEECFIKMQTALVENQEIFDYLSGEEKSIAYASNEKQLSLTFWMTNQ